MKPFLSFSLGSARKYGLSTAILLTAAAVQAQMSWSSYDTSGNLIAANIASGGDLSSGTSVTFTVPATTQLTFVTKGFTPFSLAGASSKKVVTFNFSASGGLTGVTGVRNIGWGLYNSAGTAALTDDIGYFGLYNAGGPYLETYDRGAGSGNLFSGTHLGQGTVNVGKPTDGVTYTNQIQLDMNSAATGISLGTSSSTLAACGLGLNGVNTTNRVYTNPDTTYGATTTFDEFAFTFYNSTASPVTVTLSGIALGNTLTWDASGANPAAPTDGSGFWTTAASTNANWSSGASDTTWSSGYSAVFGANNGAAGVITINTNFAGVTVSNITFNPAGSGGYNIIGSPLTLVGTPTITVASGVFATNSAPLAGTGFTKAGNGTLVLLPSVAAANVGLTTVNAGTLFLAGAGVNNLNDSVVVNPGTVLLVPSSVGINSSTTLTINGGAVTNMGLGGTSTESHNLVVFDNNGILAYGPTGNGQIVMTNCDLRSGIEMFPKFGAGMSTNFSVKSTAGTMAVQSRPNNTGQQGLILTLLAGTMILDYPNPSPNGDTTQGGAKLQSNSPLTLGGGTLFGRFNAAASRTESVTGTILWPGATTVVITNNAGNGSGAYSITMNAFTRNVGSSVDFGIGGTSTGGKTITTTTANANGILGGWATYAGANWAVGTSIAAYSAYTTSADPTTWVAANNVSLTANPSANVPAATTINSLRLAGTSALTLNGALTLSSGGLLTTGSGANSISGGTLTGGNGTDLIVQQYSSGDLTIGSTLVDNTTATSLTKSGPGKLILTGTDSLTGTNYLNGGTVEVSDLAQLAAGPMIMNNGALHYVGTDASSTRSVVLAGIGGTFDIQSGTTLTQTKSVVSAGGATSPAINGVNLNLGDWSGLTKNGNGTLVLATNNIYNGPTVVNAGTLLINGTNSLTGTSGTVNYSGGGSFTVYGGTLGGTGMITGPVTIKNTGTVAAGNSIGTLTLASGLVLESGATALFNEQNGSNGSLLQVQGNLTVGANSTIAVKVLGAALNPTTNVIITYTGTKTGSFNPTVTLAGGSLNSSVSIDQSTPGQIKLVTVPQIAITAQPQDLIASTNDSVTFSVTATGSATIGYQWYFAANVNDTPVGIPGATSASYNIPSADGTNNGFYEVVVTNDSSSVTSRLASLIIGNVLPQLSGPANKTVIQGNNVTFTGMAVFGNPTPTLQWQTNGVNVDGATGTNLTLTAVPFALDGTTVSLIASNAAGTVTNYATLSVIVPPVITPAPNPITANVGDTINFISGATGVPTPGLQWYKNGVGLSGQTSGTLTIANVQGANIGNYYLIATNAAGSITSSVVKLTVNSTTLAQTTLAPANGATAVCYDTPLYISFNGPISIANSGKIRIYNITNSTTPVDTIDMGGNAVVVSTLNSGLGVYLTNNIQPHSLFSGDPQVINYFPVILSGNTAAIYPHGGVLTSNQTYYVTMDNGVVADSTGAYFAGISATNVWQFSTKVGGPANPTNLVVAADGSGDFVTVQGAVDAVPAGNNAYMLVNVRNGIYTEIVDISGKSNITFRGQSRLGTVVGYPNNNNLTGTTAGRMAFKVNGSDIKLENLTITNGTPQGGSQAEALLIYNFGFHCVVNNCDIVSRQDTILVNATTSQCYFYNCKVIGNFDYIWGSGVGYFDTCIFHTIPNIYSSSYNLTAARTLTAASSSTNTPWQNPNLTTYSGNGFSFVNCRMEADNGVTGISLAGSNGTAGGLGSWFNCFIDTNAYVSPQGSLSNTYVFWQNSNKEITGTYPVSFTNVQTIGVTNNDPRLLAATNIQTWFYGWVPQMAVNLTTNPANQSVSAGQAIALVSAATGVPAPTYQWFKNGTNLPTATSATLSIASAQRSDGGTYYVVASNSSGSVTSSVATVTYNNTAPVAFNFTMGGLLGSPATVLVVGGKFAPTDADNDPLTVTVVSGETNGTVTTDGASITYTPTNGPVDTFTYTVSDGFGGTATGTVSVAISSNVQGYNQLSATSLGGGVNVLTFAGIPTYNYALDLTTNLTPPINWLPQATNPAANNGSLIFTNISTEPQSFYRTRYVP